MIVENVEIFDYFSQFTLLVRCQREAGEIQRSFFDGNDTVASEENLERKSRIILSTILRQRALRLFPEEKRRYCFILTELCIGCQNTLLRIPKLSRIYSVPAFYQPLHPLSLRADLLSLDLEEFFAPENASERFSCKRAECILNCCIEGISQCRDLNKTAETATNSGVERFFFKDLVDEFFDLFSLSIQFTHCGLVFPLS